MTAAQKPILIQHTNGQFELVSAADVDRQIRQIEHERRIYDVYSDFDTMVSDAETENKPYRFFLPIGVETQRNGQQSLISLGMCSDLRANDGSKILTLSFAAREITQPTNVPPSPEPVTIDSAGRIEFDKQTLRLDGKLASSLTVEIEDTIRTFIMSPEEPNLYRASHNQCESIMVAGYRKYGGKHEIEICYPLNADSSNETFFIDDGIWIPLISISNPISTLDLQPTRTSFRQRPVVNGPAQR